MRFTILGGSGFIGSHLAAHLRSAGHDCQVPLREDVATLGGALGHVVYCIGLTADFRSRPFDTVEAHAGLLGRVLRRVRCESFLYLSSTRLYGPGGEAVETAFPTVDPADVYNTSKLAGEALCLAAGRPGVRVARLSNVYGGDGRSGSFLDNVLTGAALSGSVHLYSALGSEKDYIHVDDAVAALARIALEGRERLYNVASGSNVGNRAIVERLGCPVSVEQGAPTLRMPPVSVARLQGEFPFAPRRLLDDLPGLVSGNRQS